MPDIHCPLCGYEFDPGRLECHSKCPMGQRCALICCPNCGYQMPDEARTHVVSWLRRRLARLASVSEPRPERQAATIEDHCPLSRLPVGTTAQVAAIRSARSARLERLSLLGIVPGSEVRLEQRWPAIVIRVGETELSLDEDVADQIIVAYSPGGPRRHAHRRARRRRG